MKLTEIIELFRSVAANHVEINAFYTSLPHEINNANIQYPALRLMYPYSVSPISLVDETITYKFKLNMLVNTVKVDTGSMNYEVNVNNNNVDSQLNEITSIEIYENQMREKALQLIMNFLQKLFEFEELGNDEYFQVSAYNITSLERYANDFVTGVEISLDIITSNDYLCESKANFNNAIWFS